MGLRIDWCGSSVLFLGDAEAAEDAELQLGPADLLAVPHHGSRTSTSQALLRRVRPRYAVISAGRGNRYCHPAASTIAHLDGTLAAGSRATPVLANVSQGVGRGCGWQPTERSARLWVTAADGEVDLVTRGGGVFTRAPALR
jgi:hypothetical protein